MWTPVVVESTVLNLNYTIGCSSSHARRTTRAVCTVCKGYVCVACEGNSSLCDKCWLASPLPKESDEQGLVSTDEALAGV